MSRVKVGDVVYVYYHNASLKSQVTKVGRTRCTVPYYGRDEEFYIETGRSCGKSASTGSGFYFLTQAEQDAHAAQERDRALFRSIRLGMIESSRLSREDVAKVAGFLRELGYGHEPLDDRSDLIRHLHEHPDHAGRYPAGHDFVLVSTADIRRDHERQHERKG